MTPSSVGLRFTGQFRPRATGRRAASRRISAIESKPATRARWSTRSRSSPRRRSPSSGSTTITLNTRATPTAASSGWATSARSKAPASRSTPAPTSPSKTRPSISRPTAAATCDSQPNGSDAQASFSLELRDDRKTPKYTSYVLRFTGSDGRPNRDPVKFPIDVHAGLRSGSHHHRPRGKNSRRAARRNCGDRSRLSRSGFRAGRGPAPRRGRRPSGARREAAGPARTSITRAACCSHRTNTT